MGRVWEKFELGRAPIREERVSTAWERKQPKRMPFPHAFMFHFPSHFLGTLRGPFDHPSFIHKEVVHSQSFTHALVILF